jgi:hypothetical protein
MKDYEIINSRREEYESKLLNNISVIYNDIKFPLFFNKQDYIILEFLR